MKSLLASAAVLALLAVPAAAQSNSGTTSNPEHLTQQDGNFAHQAAIGNLTEIEAGRAAEQHGASAAVREFGHWLVTDHTLAQQLLELSVRYTNIQLPRSLDPQHQQMVQGLSHESGQQFDRKFLTTMVQDHQRDAAEYQREAQDGHGRLKGYAMLTLPAVQAHMQEAQRLEGMAHGGGMAGGAQGAGGSAAVGSGSTPSNPQ